MTFRTMTLSRLFVKLEIVKEIVKVIATVIVKVIMKVMKLLKTPYEEKTLYKDHVRHTTG